MQNIMADSGGSNPTTPENRPAPAGSFSFPETGHEGGEDEDGEFGRKELDCMLARAASSRNLLSEFDSIEISDSPIPSLGLGSSSQDPVEKHDQLQTLLKTAESKLASMFSQRESQ